MKPPARRRCKPVAKDRADLPAPRPLVWMGSSKDDISAMPVEVKASFGLRLYELQVGRTPLEKPLIQLVGWVYELRDSFDGNAYRVVYVINLGKALYMLHAFVKKSKSGIGLPKPDAALIETRLRRARELDARED
jgi:phage-related protein